MTDLKCKILCHPSSLHFTYITVQLPVFHFEQRLCMGIVLESHCIWNWDTRSNCRNAEVLYLVCFSDGRTRHNVKHTEFLSTSLCEFMMWKEMMRLLHGETLNATKRAFGDIENSVHEIENHNPKRMCTRSSLTLQQLFSQRCQKCSSCCLPDCGKCESCVINSTTTSKSRLVCLLNMCDRMKTHQKQQTAILGWKYFFRPCHHCSPSIQHLHSAFQRLRLIAPNTSYHDSVSILTALHVSSSPVELGSFFEDLLGQPLHEACTHELEHKGYMIEWLRNGRNAARISLSGVITKCWKHLIHGTHLFTIQYNTGVSTSGCINDDNLFLKKELVSEQMAWGGHKRYSLTFHKCQHLGNSKVLLNVPYTVNWLIPSKRYETTAKFKKLPMLMIEFRNCLLQFEAKSSSIEGAGTGLFVRLMKGHAFTLKAGEMLDLGVYAPQKKSDVKSKHISLLKNVIYDWNIETWAFATVVKSHKNFVYDTTNDFTGLRHDAARRNIISYVNEISHNDQVANVSAQYDPEGQIHYLLGHWEENEGAFNIPSNGNEIELLVSTNWHNS
jgi:hypothetical protein